MGMNTKCVWWYELVDGNYSKRPCAYCKSKKKALTEKLIKVHKCEKRQCTALDKTYKFE